MVGPFGILAFRQCEGTIPVIVKRVVIGSNGGC